jgi:hypothetical protein
MATTLDVINDCLATMGEAPLNTLLEPHEFKGAAQKALSRANKSVQATGWWFNLEAATLVPSPSNGYVQLPGDCLKWQSGVRTADQLVRNQAKPWLVERGNKLYDTRNRTYVITEEVVGELVREVPFEELPTVVNAYIAAEAVLKFQSNFDADNSKRQELTQSWSLCRIDAKAENIRQLGVNLLNNNSRLSRIKAVTRRLRY